MGIQFCDGFDQYSVEADVKRYWVQIQTSLGIELDDSDTPYNRGRALKFTNHNATHSGLGILLPNPTDTIGFSFHLKLLTIPAADNRRAVFELLFGSNFQNHLRITPEGAFAFYWGSLTSSSVLFQTPALPLNEWVHVEIKIVVANSGSVEIRFNGNTVASQSGVDTQGYNTTALVDQVRLGRQANTSNAGSFLIDNFVCWDGSGVTNNDFLGDVEVYTLLPTADDDTMDWTPSEGSDGYAMIDDEVPDGDDTYISSDTPDAQAVFELDNLPDENMRVLAVQPFVVARKDDSGNRAVKVGIVSGEDTTEASAFSLGTSYAMTSTLYEANPATGLPWEKAEVNALKLSVKVA